MEVKSHGGVLEDKLKYLKIKEKDIITQLMLRLVAWIAFSTLLSILYLVNPTTIGFILSMVLSTCVTIIWITPKFKQCRENNIQINEIKLALSSLPLKTESK